MGGVSSCSVEVKASQQREQHVQRPRGRRVPGTAVELAACSGRGAAGELESGEGVRDPMV